MLNLRPINIYVLYSKVCLFFAQSLNLIYEDGKPMQDFQEVDFLNFIVWVEGMINVN